MFPNRLLIALLMVSLLGAQQMMVETGWSVLTSHLSHFLDPSRRSVDHDARNQNNLASHDAGLGKGLADVMLTRQVADIPGLGPMLLPGNSGLTISDGWFELSASYLPLQVLLRVSSITREKRSRQIAEWAPTFLARSSPKGLILDWITYRPDAGFAPYPSPAVPDLASYDAILVSFCAGLLAPGRPGSERIWKTLSEMAAYVDQTGVLVATVSETGKILDPHGNVGFLAVVAPFFDGVISRKIRGTTVSAPVVCQKLEMGSLGHAHRPYDQNLAYLATRWLDKRFYFNERDC